MPLAGALERVAANAHGSANAELMAAEPDLDFNRYPGLRVQVQPVRGREARRRGVAVLRHRRERATVCARNPAKRDHARRGVRNEGRALRLRVERTEREHPDQRVRRRQRKDVQRAAARRAHPQLPGAHARGVRRRLEPADQGLLPLRFLGRLDQAVEAGVAPSRSDLQGAPVLRVQRRLVAAVAAHLRERVGRPHGEDMGHEHAAVDREHTGAPVRDPELRLEQVQPVRPRHRLRRQDLQDLGHSEGAAAGAGAVRPRQRGPPGRVLAPLGDHPRHRLPRHDDGGVGRLAARPPPPAVQPPHGVLRRPRLRPLHRGHDRHRRLGPVRLRLDAGPRPAEVRRRGIRVPLAQVSRQAVVSRGCFAYAYN